MNASSPNDDYYGSSRRKRRKVFSLSQFFTDRQPESESFMQSVWARDADLSADRVTPESLNNILLFHGFGGLGKTQLSLGLQSWVDTSFGGGRNVPEHWGAPPTPDRPIVTARWDLNDSRGNLDPVTLLLSLRAALHKKSGGRLPHKTWRAFDIAFGAYAAQVRPGQPLDPTDTGTGYASQLPSMIGEVALETVVDVGAGVGMQGLRDAARVALGYVRRRQALSDYPGLAELIEDCLTSESGSVNPELASDVLFLIDFAIKKMEPAQRPLIIVFVDHLERVQGGANSTRTGEHLLNEFVGALPHALFVMTGRNRLDWYKPERTGLAHAGVSKWPCLQPDIALRPKNPRPHVLEVLSTDDAREWIQRQAAELNLPFSPGVVENLVHVTGCWPVHIDAVFDLAQVKVRDGATILTVEDLDGSFDDVVQRLLEDLPADEQAALQAACLLPYFDGALINTMTSEQVSGGTIERLVNRAVVLENFDSWYEYRVHDEVRRAVRAAGPNIQGGWTDADWSSRAKIALTHALTEALAAREKRDDEATLAGVGLAITIAAEYGVAIPDPRQPEDDGITRARRIAPSHSALLTLIPPSGQVTHPAVHALIRLVEVLAEPVSEPSIEALAEIAKTGAPCMTDALVWRAYRLRSFDRCVEAAEQFTWLLANGPDRSIRLRRRLYSRQIATSYSMGRRFLDAERANEIIDEDQAEVNRITDRALHGHLDERYFANLRTRISKADPRFAMELHGTLHHRLARVGRLDREAAENFLEHATRFGHRTGQRLTVTGLALDAIAKGLDFNLASADVFDTERPMASKGEVLALKALRDGPDAEFFEWLEQAPSRVNRGRAWIPVEMLLDHLGYPLPPVDTQWLEPVEDVRVRWVGHYVTLVGA